MIYPYKTVHKLDDRTPGMTDKQDVTFRDLLSCSLVIQDDNKKYPDDKAILVALGTGNQPLVKVRIEPDGNITKAYL